MSRSARRILAMAGFAALALTAPALPAVAAPAPAAAHPTARVCAEQAKPGMVTCFAERQTDTMRALLSPARCPAGSTLGSALRLQSHRRGQRLGHRGHRRLQRRPERRIGPRELPFHLRAPALHHRERLFQESERKRADQPASVRRFRLGGRNLARRRHGFGDLPELPHPARRSEPAEHGRSRHRGEHRRVDGREVRVQQLRRRRRRLRTLLRLQLLPPPGRRDHREHRRQRLRHQLPGLVAVRDRGRRHLAVPQQQRAAGAKPRGAARATAARATWPSPRSRT